MKADFFGLPDYFINSVECESAGTGNMRIYCSTIRHGEIVPAFSVVISIPEAIQAVATVKAQATELWNEATFRTLEFN